MATGGARVHIYGDWDGSGVKKAQQDIGAFEKQATGFSGSFTKSMLGVGAALGGAFAIGNIIGSTVDYLRDAAAAAIEDEKSMVSLAKAMENVGLAGQNAGTEDFIKKLMLATGVADDQLRPAMQRLVTATGDATESQKLLNLALDISAATGKDVTSVAQGLGRAANGSFGALQRLGVPLDANIVKSKDFGAAVDVLSQKFGGQAAAAAETYGGQLQRVQTAAGEAQETIGYALLDAVESATQAFGGAGGMVEAITAAGEKAADLVAGLGLAVTALGDLKVAADGVDVGIGDASISLGDLAKNAVMAVPMVGAQVQALGFLADKGHEVRASQDAINSSLDASEQLYAGYIASLDGSAASQRAVEDAASAASDALDDMKASFDAVNGSMSAQDKMDAYRLAVIGIKNAVDDTSRSLGFNSEAGLKNRDVIRGVFQDAQDAAISWGEQNGKTTEEVQRKFAEMTTNVRQKLIDQGFKAEDIDKFLGGLGLWTTQTQTLAAGLTNGAAAEAMRLTGLAFADKTKSGFTAQMSPGGAAYEAMSDRMTKLAESLRRETTITVTTVNRSTYESQVPAAARRAKGGPISAGDVYLVGEKGPELFVSDQSGTIVPNHNLGLPMASGAGGGGSNYTINVATGVGDPRQIGQQVIEYIKRFEQANGAVFVAA